MSFFDEAKDFRLRNVIISNEWALYVFEVVDDQYRRLLVQMAIEVSFRVGDDQILATSEEVLIACTM